MRALTKKKEKQKQQSQRPGLVGARSPRGAGEACVSAYNNNHRGLVPLWRGGIRWKVVKNYLLTNSSRPTPTPYL